MVERNILPGTVLDIRPVAVYQETVYTQLLRVKVTDGTEVLLFDSMKRCSEEYLNQEIMVDVTVPHFAGIVSGSAGPPVEPPSYRDTSATLRGELVELNRDGPDYGGVIDIGFGRLKLDLSKYQLEAFDGYTAGDAITIENGQLYVTGVEPVESS